MASSTTDTHSEVGVAEGPAPFPPFQTETYPSQLLWLVITFGLFYYLMAKVALPRISSILEVRSDRIEQDLDEANRMQGESDAAIAAYEQSAAEAQANAQVIRQEATDAAKVEADTLRAAEEAKLADLIAKSEAGIAATKSAAMGRSMVSPLKPPKHSSMLCWKAKCPGPRSRLPFCRPQRRSRLWTQHSGHS